MEHRGTLLTIPILEEKYSTSLLASFGLHVALVLFFLAAPYILPRPEPIRIGGGPGGGIGGEVYTVGVADDLGGGAGMTKPSLIPQPPALSKENAAKEEIKEAVPIPDTIAPKKKISRTADVPPLPATKPARSQAPPVIPTAPMPGAGGSGGVGGGAGGGRGGGSGVSVGPGTGGFGDSWYARVVEARISRNWIKPGEGVRVEIVYSFFIAPDGSIYDVKKEKSCGNEALDLSAERAIRASNPLTAPPPELRNRPVQFVAQFVYPPNP